MNLLGKALTFAVFALSIVFMVVGLAVNASHRNWRDVVLGPGGLKQQIETVETTNDQLRDSAQRTQAALDRERAARRTALAALQTQLNQLQQELVQSAADVEALRAANTELTQLDRSRAADLEAKTEEITRLRAALVKEREDRDTLFAKSLELTDLLNRARGTVQNQKQRNDQLRTQVTRLQEVVEAKGIDVNAPLDGAPPERNGVVLVVNRPRKQVEVSIGSDDGLRQGHLLDVTRNGSFVTRLRVGYTEPDRAVAEILSDYSNRTIQEGDRVDTTYE
ncbi:MULTISPECIES: hypothetical protein [Crateriforma]|uniref:Chromosome partition protein Smc n=1 Tax=Crateriforma conspicua TaxID=2527996 RepID=A0A5C6FKB9_9PLAN|nr:MULTISPECIES: hypothetical protein [Crateriforma]QDV62126.1 Chromosome partition protein Smc [Crateriforma conspicua]TWT71704.1 Chromosome partition protein Smc [Crateriforma conspicua]TWU62427.1 Chromosome partition protein Smc [Crateriforma conspicua]